MVLFDDISLTCWHRWWRALTSHKVYAETSQQGKETFLMSTKSGKTKLENVLDVINFNCTSFKRNMALSWNAKHIQVNSGIKKTTISYAVYAFSLIFCVGRTLWSPFKVPWGTLTQEPTCSADRAPEKADNTAPVWTKRVVQRTVTQQEAEGETVPDRILHEGRGQGQSANPGFSSPYWNSCIAKLRKPVQGLC